MNVALKDGFIRLEECEEREGEEGQVGVVFVHPGRIGDAVINPSLPDAFLYEPERKGKLKLVGVELVIPFAAWTGTEPPRFFGAEMEREDEFGVFGIHVWIWRHNPNGIFAVANPRVSCES